jgi:putative intracellular protease/amidase
MPEQGTRIGVLALQGSYREHMSMLQRVPGVDVIEVRTKEELQSVSGLIIPGGESTTMALVAERWGLIPELQSFAKAGKPVWGTCAGMIFLAERAEGARASRGRAMRLRRGCAQLRCARVRAGRAGGAPCTCLRLRPARARGCTGRERGGSWVGAGAPHSSPAAGRCPGALRCRRCLDADAPARRRRPQAPRRAARPS